MRCVGAAHGRACWRISDELRYLSVTVMCELPTAAIAGLLDELARIARRAKPDDSDRSTMAKEFVEKAAEVGGALLTAAPAPAHRVTFRRMRYLCEEFWDRRTVSTEASAGAVRYFASICYYNLSRAVEVRAARVATAEVEGKGERRVARDIFIDAGRRLARVYVKYIEDLSEAEIEEWRRKLEGADFATLVRLAL